MHAIPKQLCWPSQFLPEGPDKLLLPNTFIDHVQWRKWCIRVINISGPSGSYIMTSSRAKFLAFNAATVLRPFDDVMTYAKVAGSEEKLFPGASYITWPWETWWSVSSSQVSHLFSQEKMLQFCGTFEAHEVTGPMQLLRPRKLSVLFWEIVSLSQLQSLTKVPHLCKTATDERMTSLNSHRLSRHTSDPWWRTAHRQINCLDVTSPLCRVVAWPNFKSPASGGKLAAQKNVTSPVTTQSSQMATSLAKYGKSESCVKCVSLCIFFKSPFAQ